MFLNYLTSFGVKFNIDIIKTHFDSEVLFLFKNFNVAHNFTKDLYALMTLIKRMLVKL